MKNKSIGIILLAAGASNRLGRPKQLLEFEGKSLLEKAIKWAKLSLATHFVVVLGANADEIRKKIDQNGCSIIVNVDWPSGMGSSMKKGLKHLTDLHQVDGVLLMLCDQPYANADVLNALIQTYWESEKGIIASRYQNTLGVPALFDKKYFGEMLNLKSSEGAKKIILSHSDDTEAIDFPLGAIDIDTEEDYEKLKNQPLN
ncbi:nucleotidyltransferase family protein [Shivajiella indica]|uniref:NTP transferase domain-containing protein n=1 Tax=Shivajiella indica TaxID=872115 RepID=A0ABW5B8M5_9BACT